MTSCWSPRCSTRPTPGSSSRPHEPNDNPPADPFGSAGGRIILVEGLAPAKEFSIITHELAHEMLHKRDAGEKRLPKTIRETEAEAVAFVVCQAIGLDTNTAASDYIQLYAGDKDTLGASLDRIQHTATAIIQAVTSDEVERQAA